MDRDIIERVARAIFNASMLHVGRTVLWTDDVTWPEERIRNEARQCARAAIAAMQGVDAHAGVRCPHCDHQHGRSWEGTPTNSIMRTETCAQCGGSFRCWEDTETIYRAATDDGAARQT